VVLIGIESGNKDSDPSHYQTCDDPSFSLAVLEDTEFFQEGSFILESIPIKNFKEKGRFVELNRDIVSMFGRSL